MRIDVPPHFLAVLSVIFLAHSSVAAKRPFRVVIDPGHGGSDEGTVYDNGMERVSEKEVTLALAKRVAQQLKAKGFSVTLTRNRDIEIPLPARTALANRLEADIFISIHMNSTPGYSPPEADGVETYILNHTTNATSRRLARLENRVISSRFKGSPEQVDIALILKDLRLDGNISESKRLACNIQRNLVSIPGIRSQRRKRRNRGVKEALFYVLLGADMPSVLVEAGFLNSPIDRALVLSPRGQTIMSRAIARAVDQFRKYTPTEKSHLAIDRCKIN